MFNFINRGTFAQSIQNCVGLLQWQKVNSLEINDCFRAIEESEGGGGGRSDCKNWSVCWLICVWWESSAGDVVQKRKKTVFFFFSSQKWKKQQPDCGIHKGKGSVLQGDTAELVAFCPLRRKARSQSCCFCTRVSGKGAFKPSVWHSPVQFEVCQELCTKSVGFRQMISVSAVYNYWCLPCKLVEAKALLVPIKLKHAGGCICAMRPSVSSCKHASSPHRFGFGSGCCCDGAAFDFPASVFWRCNYYRLALHPTGLVPLSPCSSQLLPWRHCTHLLQPPCGRRQRSAADKGCAIRSCRPSAELC